MDSKEIMIGDWLLWDNTLPCIVTTVSCDYIETTKCGITLAESHFLQGVPLTPKILEKNGFTVFLDFKDLVYYESDDKRIKATNSEGMKNTPNAWSIHIDTKDMSTMAYGEVTYVHEFQHLLRLCGIDKEVEI